MLVPLGALAEAPLAYPALEETPGSLRWSGGTDPVEPFAKKIRKQSTVFGQRQPRTRLPRVLLVGCGAFFLSYTVCTSCVLAAAAITIRRLCQRRCPSQRACRPQPRLRRPRGATAGPLLCVPRPRCLTPDRRVAPPCSDTLLLFFARCHAFSLGASPVGPRAALFCCSSSAESAPRAGCPPAAAAANTGRPGAVTRL